MSIIEPEPCPVAIDPSKLTPAQQVALLTLHRHPLSKAVVDRLKASTVRAGIADYRVLAELGLAVRGDDGWHQLTAAGAAAAPALARRLACEFNVTLTRPGRRYGHVRKTFTYQATW